MRGNGGGRVYPFESDLPPFVRLETPDPRDGINLQLGDPDEGLLNLGSSPRPRQNPVLPPVGGVGNSRAVSSGRGSRRRGVTLVTDPWEAAVRREARESGASDLGIGGRVGEPRSVSGSMSARGHQDTLSGFTRLQNSRVGAVLQLLARRDGSDAEASVVPGLGTYGAFGGKRNQREGGVIGGRHHGILPAKSFDETLGDITGLLRTRQNILASFTPGAEPVEIPPATTGGSGGSGGGGNGIAGGTGAEAKQRSLRNTASSVNGRTTLRSVAAASLDKKLQALRNNPDAWAEFHKRVCKLRQDRVERLKVQTARTRAYTTTMGSFTPREAEGLRTARFMRKWEKHQAVRERAESRMDQQRKRRVDLCKTRGAMSEDLFLPRRKGATDTLKEKWLTIILLAARVGTVVEHVREDRQTRGVMAEANHASVIIQRAWRTFKNAKENQKKAWAATILGNRIYSYALRKRVQRRNAAADTLVKFMGEISGVKSITKIVARFRRCVLQAQRYSRDALATHEAQLDVLMRAWDRVHARRNREITAHNAKKSPRDGGGGSSFGSGRGKDGGSRTPRSRSSQQSRSSSSRHSRNRRGGGKKSSGGDGGSTSTKLMFPTIPANIKRAVVEEDLLKRKRSFGVQIMRFQRQMEEHNAFVKEAEGIERARILAGGGASFHPSTADEMDLRSIEPQCPTFRLLVSVADMESLQDEGVRRLDVQVRARIKNAGAAAL